MLILSMLTMLFSFILYTLCLVTLYAVQSLRYQLHSRDPERYFYKQGNGGRFCVCTSNLNILCLAMFEFGTLLLGIIAKISTIKS